MSRKRPQEEYGESLAGRFKRWLDGERTLCRDPGDEAPGPGAGARGAV